MSVSSLQGLLLEGLNVDNEDRKFLAVVVLCVVASLLLGFGVSYGCGLFVNQWLLGVLLAVAAYVASAIVRPLFMRGYRDRGGDPFAEGTAMMATMMGNMLGCLPIMLLTGLYWIGSVIGIWVSAGFLATVIVNLLWPVATIVMLIVEVRLMEITAHLRRRKNHTPIS